MTISITILCAAILSCIAATAVCAFGLGVIAATSTGRRVRQAGPLRAEAPAGPLPASTRAARPGDHATAGEASDLERIAAMSAGERYDALVWLSYIAPDAFARSVLLLDPIEQ